MKKYRFYVEKIIEYSFEGEAESLLGAWRVADDYVLKNVEGLDGTQVALSLSDIQEIKPQDNPAELG